MSAPWQGMPVSFGPLGEGRGRYVGPVPGSRGRVLVDVPDPHSGTTARVSVDAQDIRRGWPKADPKPAREKSAGKRSLYDPNRVQRCADAIMALLESHPEGVPLPPQRQWVPGESRGPFISDVLRRLVESGRIADKRTTGCIVKIVLRDGRTLTSRRGNYK